jgi:hypothetical protein
MAAPGGRPYFSQLTEFEEEFSGPHFDSGFPCSETCSRMTATTTKSSHDETGISILAKETRVFRGLADICAKLVAADVALGIE